MPRFSANLSMLYPELPFMERFGAAAADGFVAAEYGGAYCEDWGVVRESPDIVALASPPGLPLKGRCWAGGCELIERSICNGPFCRRVHGLQNLLSVVFTVPKKPSSPWGVTLFMS